MNDNPRLYRGEADLQLTFPDGTILASRVYIDISQEKETSAPWGELMEIRRHPYRFSGQTTLLNGKGPTITITPPRFREIQKAIGDLETRSLALAHELEDAKKTLSDLRGQLTAIPTS